MFVIIQNRRITFFSLNYYKLPFSLGLHHGALFLRIGHINHLLFLTFWEQYIGPLLPLWLCLQVHNLMNALGHLDILDLISEERNAPLLRGRPQLLQYILVQQLPALKSLIFLLPNPYLDSICQSRSSWYSCWVFTRSRWGLRRRSCTCRGWSPAGRPLRRCGWTRCRG